MSELTLAKIEQLVEKYGDLAEPVLLNACDLDLFESLIRTALMEFYVVESKTAIEFQKEQLKKITDDRDSACKPRNDLHSPQTY